MGEAVVEILKRRVDGDGISLEEKIEVEENPILARIQEKLRDPSYERFELSKSFVNKYQDKDPGFGFNGVGEFTFRRTYSRDDNGVNEEWFQTIERVVNGTYNMQKRWVEERGLPWNDQKGQDSAQEMYDKMFHMKFLPPGRGLWAMGSPITEKKGIYAALNNCAFVSTKNIKEDLAAPFTFLMDASMLGVGVGFDTRGAGQMIVKGPNKKRKSEFFDIPDSREGWVDSVRFLIESYFLGTAPIEFGYDKIRPRGRLIKGFGGLSSGPDPLIEVHKDIRGVLDRNASKPLSERSIVDIQNLIGRCVVAGNVRRTAEVALGDPDSDEYLDLKNYRINPDRTTYGWTSNNSVFAEVGMDYGPITERTRINGEPGFMWLENAKKFGRMKDPENNKDHRAEGANPCLEQTLESYELCCLVETFPHRHESKEEFLRTLKFAYLYAKTVTLAETHWPETNRVMLRNRRIGCSMSGLTQFIAKRGIDELKKWSEEGYNTIQYYDEVYSDWLATPKSIKTTSIKPSGSVSLLAGATPGVHFPEAEYYIRRIRVGVTSPLIEPLKGAGYTVEPQIEGRDENRNPKYSKDTLVVEFPVHAGKDIRSEDEVSMWEKLSIATLMQEYWADNQVSCTVSFNPETEGEQIKYALDHFQYRLKGVSFLPKTPKGAYDQMPYERINQEQYEEMTSRLKPLNFKGVSNKRELIDAYCDAEICEIPKSG